MPPESFHRRPGPGAREKRRLVVHIGANKTGSSAVQKFLSVNVGSLRELGIIVPSQRFAATRQVSGFHVYAFAELLSDPVGPASLTASIRTLAKAHPDAGAILLSAENLMAHPDAPGLFRGLLDEFDLRVVAYVRRQDDLLLSSWQQWHSKGSADFWAYALEAVGILGDWAAHLTRWEEVVSRDRITVRVFEKGKLHGGDVIDDFSRCVGLPIGRLRRPDHPVNPSFDAAALDLVAGNPTIFADNHDNDFYRLLWDLTRDHYVRPRRESTITFAQRLAIVGAYSACNAWLRDAYFGGEDGYPFAPVAENEHDVPDQGTMAGRKLEILASMIYRAHGQGKLQDG